MWLCCEKSLLCHQGPTPKVIIGVLIPDVNCLQANQHWLAKQGNIGKSLSPLSPPSNLKAAQSRQEHQRGEVTKSAIWEIQQSCFWAYQESLQQLSHLNVDLNQSLNPNWFASRSFCFLGTIKAPFHSTRENLVWQSQLKIGQKLISAVN